MNGKIAAGAGVAIGTAALAIIANVFGVEGDFSNHRDDPGGATRFGVTEKVARAKGYDGPMERLPQELAASILYSDYIVAPGFHLVLERSPAVAEEAIDSGYNAGANLSAKWLQRSLNLFNNRERDWPDVAVDGTIGPATMRAFQAMEVRRGRAMTCELLLKSMDGLQAAHYIALAEGKGQGGNTRFESFTTGWFRTRIGNVTYDRCRP